MVGKIKNVRMIMTNLMRKITKIENDKLDKKITDMMRVLTSKLRK